MIKCIVSGGQTGADIAAFDAAIACRVDYRGWVPKGRLNENGIIPSLYEHLKESPSEEPNVRTELNVRDSDATIIFSHGPLLGGSEYTFKMAEKYKKPVIHIDLDRCRVNEAIAQCQEWLATIDPKEVNIAGPRASDDPAIYEQVREIVVALLDRTV